MSHAVLGARYMQAGAPTPRWSSLREWGIRPKLIIVLAIPTLAALSLGAVGMVTALNQTKAYSHVAELSSAAKKVSVLVTAMQAERDLTTDRVARNRPTAAGVDQQRVAVDQAAAELQSGLNAIDTSYDPVVKRDTAAALNALSGVPLLRARTALGPDAALQVFRSYTTIIDTLLTVYRSLWVGADDADFVQQVTALDSVSRAAELASQQRALLDVALVTGGFRGSALADLTAARAKQDAAVASFMDRATADSQQLYRSTVSGVEVDRAAAVLRKAVASGSTENVGADAYTWYLLKSEQVDRTNRVAAEQLQQIAQRALRLKAVEQRGAAGAGLIILLILLFALVATAVVARSMIRPLQRLRTAAFEVADHGLPDVVRRLHAGESQDFDANVHPVDVAAKDEIGQVARAFDEVHAQAVRLAGEQALMRKNMSAMFVNLSRRSQSLVERQLRVIDELETSEQDPDQLASLFTLDLLATRMRRNDENLLVLAGAEGGRRWNTPVALLDVVRAAVAEVEQYARVRTDVEPGFEIVSSSVGGVVHLLAELLENAASFSAPGTPVEVRARSLGASDEVMIEVEDQGIGMTASQMAEANERLAAPPVFDVSASRMMGLYVVARLAQRHDVRVRLRSSPHGGVIALVQLPARLVLSTAAAAASDGRRQQQAQRQPETLSSNGSSGRDPLSDDSGALIRSANRAHDTNRAYEAPRTPDSVRAYDAPQAPEPVWAYDATPAPVRAHGPTRAYNANRTQDTASEPLPIFDTVQSEWFSKPPEYDLPAAAPSPAPGPAAQPVAEPPPRRAWTSPADEGWRVAQAVSTPVAGGVTSAGLPIRVRGSNLVPGTAATNTPANAHRPPAHAARGLSSFQRGVARGRNGAEVTPPSAPDSAGTQPANDQAEHQQEARP